MVTGQQELLVISIPNGKSKHTTEPFNAPFAHFLIKVKDNFGIAVGAEDVAFLAKLMSKGLVIVSFTVVNDPYCTVFVTDGLTAVRQINNTQALAAQTDMIIYMSSRIIRPAMDYWL
jgi:hypothetical protein